MSSVLVCRLDSDGDVLLTGPAVRAIAADTDRVTYLCSNRGRSAAALLPGVDDVMVYDAPWILFDPPPVDPAAVADLVAEVRRRDIDRAVIFTSFHQSALPTALLLRTAGVRHISAISDDYPGSLLDVRHRVDDDIHEVERNLSLAAAAGFRLPATDDDALRVKFDDSLGRPFDEPYVVVHPGAAVPARAWAPEHHADLVRLLVGSGRRVVVTGSAGEAALAAFVAGAPSPAVRELAGRTTLGQLASVLRDAAAVIVGNTGPAHLAAAAGAPVVSLFAATVPAVRWRPWQVPYVVLGDHSVACRHCRARECPVAGHPCIDRVTPAEVVDALNDLLAGTRAA